MNVTETAEQLTILTTIENLICTGGLIPLGFWLLKTAWGKRALSDSVPRRNDMRPFMPLIPLIIWVAVILLVAAAQALTDLPDWKKAFADNLLLSIGSIVAIGVVLLIARTSFARRLKGFGLNPKTIPKDFFAAILNLFSVWPLIMFMIMLTMFLGQFILGSDFKIQQHEELQLIAANSQLSVRVMIFITAVVTVPVFEELLFRGLFQSMIRSILLKPWASILITSLIFAMIHPNIDHWPTLFVLAVSLGYSYEKSGSLFRPIFIHSIFNAISLAAALSQ